MPQTAERGQGNVVDILRFQRMGQRVAVELRVMARTRHRANVSDACNAIGVQQGDEVLYRQGRMPDGENSAFGPVHFLRWGLFAHDADRLKAPFCADHSGYPDPNEPEVQRFPELSYEKQRESSAQFDPGWSTIFVYFRDVRQRMFAFDSRHSLANRWSG